MRAVGGIKVKFCKAENSRFAYPVLYFYLSVIEYLNHNGTKAQRGTTQRAAHAPIPCCVAAFISHHKNHVYQRSTHRKKSVQIFTISVVRVPIHCCVAAFISHHKSQDHQRSPTVKKSMQISNILVLRVPIPRCVAAFISHNKNQRSPAAKNPCKSVTSVYPVFPSPAA